MASLAICRSKHRQQLGSVLDPGDGYGAPCQSIRATIRPKKSPITESPSDEEVGNGCRSALPIEVDYPRPRSRIDPLRIQTLHGHGDGRAAWAFEGAGGSRRGRWNRRYQSLLL